MLIKKTVYIAILLLYFKANSIFSNSLFVEDKKEYDYISKWKFARLSDIKVSAFFKPFVDPHFCNLSYFNFSPENIKDNTVLYICRNCVPLFFEKIHPQIKAKYILITAEAAWSIPNQWKNYLDDKKIIAWVGIHPDIAYHKKLLIIPEGYDPRQRNLAKADEKIKALAPILRRQKKNKLLYMNFTKSSHPERSVVEKIFQNKNFCFKGKRKPFFEYLKEMAQCKFVLSPRGVGLDCFRTWEALIVGCIPIVKSSFLNPVYKDLPVLIIHDWNVITEDYLNQKYIEISRKKYNLKKLGMEYWIKKINNLKAK